MSMCNMCMCMCMCMQAAEAFSVFSSAAAGTMMRSTVTSAVREREAALQSSIHAAEEVSEHLAAYNTDAALALAAGGAAANADALADAGPMHAASASHRRCGKSLFTHG